MVRKRIKRIDDFLKYVGDQIVFSRINPTNVEEEYRLFKKNKKNPIFKYNKKGKELSALREILKEIVLGNSPEEKILSKKKRDLILKIDLIENVSEGKFSEISKLIYPAPDKELIGIAKKILKLPKSKPSKKIHKTTSINLIKSTFELLNLKWKIVKKDMITSAKVNSAKKTIFLKKRERFSENYIKRLIIHEIGTHVVRAENARLQDLKIFQGLSNYSETEEGLAAYSELEAGVMTNSILRNYAGRVLAVDYAINNTFLNTYLKLKKHFRDKTAWKLTLRAKRGLKDTSKKGAYTKDVVYLRGFLRVFKYVEMVGTSKDLFYGKISLEDLGMVKKFEKLKDIKYVNESLSGLFSVTKNHVTKEMIKELIK